MQRKLSAKAIRLCPARSGGLATVAPVAVAAGLAVAVVAAVFAGCMIQWCLYAACIICVVQCGFSVTNASGIINESDTDALSVLSPLHQCNTLQGTIAIAYSLLECSAIAIHDVQYSAQYLSTV
jgi:hypothetical protein